MRYYYDDPIKAAYMFETFKIEFETPFHYEIDYGKSSVFTGRCPAEKIYVRPERYELLKPRVGDLCSFENWSGAGSDKPNIAYGPYYEEAWDNVGLEIILRDNKAWFSPESEE